MDTTPSFCVLHVVRTPCPNRADVHCCASAKRRASLRVALAHSSLEHLQHIAAKRYGTTASRLGNIIFDEYLAIQERFYFGQERTSVVMSTQPDTRAIDAVIFDMDGVLCSSEIASRNVAVTVLGELYNLKNISPDDFAPFTGTGEGNFLRGVAELNGVTNFDEEKAKNRFFDLYIHGGYMRHVQAFPGVKSLILRLKASGLKVAVASAADRVKVDANLMAVDLLEDGLFDFVTSSDDIVNKKPAPDVFLAAARGMGIEPSRCVVVEDAVAGVMAAKAANMRCVAVATSLNAEALTEAGADLVREEPAYIALEDLFGAPLTPAVAASSEESAEE